MVKDQDYGQAMKNSLLLEMSLLKNVQGRAIYCENSTLGQYTCGSQASSVVEFSYIGYTLWFTHEIDSVNFVLPYLVS